MGSSERRARIAQWMGLLDPDTLGVGDGRGTTLGRSGVDPPGESRWGRACVDLGPRWGHSVANPGSTWGVALGANVGSIWGRCAAARHRKRRSGMPICKGRGGGAAQKSRGVDKSTRPHPPRRRFRGPDNSPTASSSSAGAVDWICVELGVCKFPQERGFEECLQQLQAQPREMFDCVNCGRT